MAADVLTPVVSRSSAAMVLTMQDRLDLKYFIYLCPYSIDDWHDMQLPIYVSSKILNT